MNSTDEINYEGKVSLPSMLNVLTILTFIGCAFMSFSLVTNYFFDCDKLIEQAEAMRNMDLPFSKFFDWQLDSVNFYCENKVLINLVSAVGIILCFLGALQMRKLKKIGLILYIMGELLLPIISLILLMNNSIAQGLIGLIIPMIFVILYATQKNNFKY